MSEKIPSLTAKIYWDRDSPDMDLSLGMRGLEWLSRLCPSVEMIEESRNTNILGANKTNVNWRAIPGTKLDATLNFVLTRKRVLGDPDMFMMVDQQVKSPQVTLGIALPAQRISSRRLAVIDVGRSLVTDQIIVHEAAHLMGYWNDDSEIDPMHCPEDACLMYHKDVDKQQHQFCEPCGDQIRSNAESLRQAKFGKFALAPNAIFTPTGFQSM